MKAGTLERIQENLQTKRQVLTSWLRNTPPEKKQVQLGSVDERAVESHVQVVETAIEKAEDKTLGICTICHEDVDTNLLEMDYTATVCLAHYSGEELNRLESELELAQSVQRALLPQQAPEIPGVELAAFSRPAQILGGDFIDFLRFQDGAYGLLIGDVAGKGVSAGLLMASVQASVRTLAFESNSPAKVLQRVNDVFCHNIHMTTFVTLFLGRLEPDLRSLTYCNAGHNPALLYHSGNGTRRVAWLNPINPAIGLVEGSRFKDQEVPLLSGDALVLYTDGVTEAQGSNGEEFGQGRLAELIERDAALPARSLVTGIQQSLQSFVDGQPLADDTTIVVCKIDGASSS